MAVYALTSAAGSPGVTTTALGLALEWPNQVLLVDADPVGGSAIQLTVAGAGESAETAAPLAAGDWECRARDGRPGVSRRACWRGCRDRPSPAHKR